jgi:hypothetical protein
MAEERGPSKAEMALLGMDKGKKQLLKAVHDEDFWPMNKQLWDEEVAPVMSGVRRWRTQTPGLTFVSGISVSGSGPPCRYTSPALLAAVFTFAAAYAA